MNFSSIFEAASNGDAKALAHALKNRAPDVDVNGRDERVPRTPLMAAASGGHHDCVKVLLKEPGIDVNAADPLYGNTSLMSAACGGHVECIKLLVTHPDIDVDARLYANAGNANDSGKTALRLAKKAAIRYPENLEILRCIALLTAHPRKK